MKNHILKEHNNPEDGQECCLLKIEGAYDKDYWLYVDIPINRTLSVLDTFLRKIWLECCGHMSGFRGAGKSTKLAALEAGYQFIHEYDYGDTTETLITVIGRTRRPPQKEIVRLLARNTPPVFSCAVCGAPARFICTECQYDADNPFYCEKCAEGHEHEDMLLFVTNSPRMGVCGYEGELDTFAYTAPQEARRKKPSAQQKPAPDSKAEAGHKQIYPDELYDLAFALKKEKPWKEQYEDELFSIPLPDGDRGYISVMGMAGEHLAVALYLGQRGLQSYCTMQSIGGGAELLDDAPNILKMQEAMLSQYCLQCSFENKTELSEEELSSAQAYAAPRKIRFRGANAFPQFIKYSPARLPAPISDREDIEILLQAMKAALAVNDTLKALRWRYTEKERLGFSGGPAFDRTYPLLTPEGDGFAWSIERFAPQSALEHPQPALGDELLGERLKRAKKTNTSWLCDLVMVPGPVADEEGAPYFPYILLSSDVQGESVLPSLFVKDYEQDAEVLLHDLGEKMLRQGPPKEIIVVDDRTFSFLKQFASTAQIKLVQNDENAFLNDLEEEFFNAVGLESLEDPEVSRIPEMIEVLLTEGNEETLLEIPEPVWGSLRRIIEEEDVPEDIRRRFGEIDRKKQP